MIVQKHRASKTSIAESGMNWKRLINKMDITLTKRISKSKTRTLTSHSCGMMAKFNCRVAESKPVKTSTNADAIYTWGSMRGAQRILQNGVTGSVGAFKGVLYYNAMDNYIDTLKLHLSGGHHTKRVHKLMVMKDRRNHRRHKELQILQLRIQYIRSWWWWKTEGIEVFTTTNAPKTFTNPKVFQIFPHTSVGIGDKLWFFFSTEAVATETEFAEFIWRHARHKLLLLVWLTRDCQERKCRFAFPVPVANEVKKVLRTQAVEGIQQFDLTVEVVDIRRCRATQLTYCDMVCKVFPLGFIFSFVGEAPTLFTFAYW